MEFSTIAKRNKNLEEIIKKGWNELFFGATELNNFERCVQKHKKSKALS